MESALTSLLLDTHVVLWWSTSELDNLSPRARAVIENADELAVASISWFELAWLAQHDRIASTVPLRTWLETMAVQVRTVSLTPAIVATATELPDSFPGDPMDRIIYATAIERGWSLVTKDERIRRHPNPRPMTLW